MQMLHKKIHIIQSHIHFVAEGQDFCHFLQQFHVGYSNIEFSTHSPLIFYAIDEKYIKYLFWYANAT